MSNDTEHARQPWEKPWDTPGLRFRTDEQRCANHENCAFRDDDPARCPWCHSTLAHLERVGHSDCLHEQRRRTKRGNRRTSEQQDAPEAGSGATRQGER